MKPFIYQGSEITFSVHLDKEKQVFDFSGKSRPENVVEFFEPIFAWFEEYSKNPNDETLISFSLEYFNSSTAKVLLKFMITLDQYYKQGINMKILWRCREYDEDMVETGEDYSTLITVPFTFEQIDD